MKTERRTHYGGLCQCCSHDLEIRLTVIELRDGTHRRGPSDGKVYCSNAKCPHYALPHPTTRVVNT